MKSLIKDRVILLIKRLHDLKNHFLKEIDNEISKKDNVTINREEIKTRSDIIHNFQFSTNTEYKKIVNKNNTLSTLFLTEEKQSNTARLKENKFDNSNFIKKNESSNYNDKFIKIDDNSNNIKKNESSNYNNDFIQNCKTRIIKNYNVISPTNILMNIIKNPFIPEKESLLKKQIQITKNKIKPNFRKNFLEKLKNLNTLDSITPRKSNSIFSGKLPKNTEMRKLLSEEYIKSKSPDEIKHNINKNNENTNNNFLFCNSYRTNFCNSVLTSQLESTNRSSNKIITPNDTFSSNSIKVFPKFSKKRNLSVMMAKIKKKLVNYEMNLLSHNIHY